MPNFTLIAFISAIESLRLANEILGSEVYTWETVTSTDKTIRSSNGFSFSPDRKLNEADSYDILFVCGGSGVHQFWNQSIGRWLRRQDANGVVLGGLCTGAYVLAKAGLLNDYKCTMHWDSIESTREEFPNLLLTNDIFVIDRNRYTCAGGTASIDLMHHLLVTEHGRSLAANVCRKLLVDNVRVMNEQQQTPLTIQIGAGHPKLIEAVRLMEANLEEQLSPKELSDYVGLSIRQLERSFKEYLNHTPMSYYRKLRLESSRRLLLQTDNSIASIALMCGFKTNAHFTTSFKSTYKIKPSEYRRSILKYNP